MVNLVMMKTKEEIQENHSEMSNDDADDLSDDTDSDDGDNFTDADLLAVAVQDEVTAQLAASGKTS